MLGVQVVVVDIQGDLDLVEVEDFHRQPFQFLPEIHLQLLSVEVVIAEVLVGDQDHPLMVEVAQQVPRDMVETVVD
jgi:hypothetical protein